MVRRLTRPPRKASQGSVVLESAWKEWEIWFILADEPTGNLDPQTSEEIMTLFVSINRDYNTTLLISTHDYIMIPPFLGGVVSTAVRGTCT